MSYISREKTLENLEEILNDENCPIFIAAAITQIISEQPEEDLVRRESTNRITAIQNILGDDYDLEHLKELVEKDKKGLFEYTKFPEKGQEVWYWDSENGISRGIIDFVKIDFCDDGLNEFGVEFPDENDFDIFIGSAWGTCIVTSMEAVLEKMNRGK